MNPLLRCPGCLSKLVDAGPSLLACEACGPYPILCGVPVLVPDPSGWCGRFHDAILAAMAEEGDVEHHEVVLVQRFAAQAERTHESFGDDWTAHEMDESEPPLPTNARAKKTVQRLLEEMTPGAWISKRIPKGRVAIEIGCGAGLRTRVLAERNDQVFAGDLSLRAVLCARREDNVLGVVLDAEALPFQKNCADVLVAENVVDLLDDPQAFLEGVSRVTRKNGVALISTPDPALGTDDEGTLAALFEVAGLHLEARANGLTWTRVNSSRFVELYFADAYALSR